MSLAGNFPSYLGGDFNLDGRVGLADYIVWKESLGAATESSLNNNGDGMNGVDIGDYNLWRRNFGIIATQTGGSGALAGDFNGNGVVDARDYVVWRQNLGAASEVFLNYNGDGLNGVDVGDYNLWRKNFGFVASQNGGSPDLTGDFNGDGVIDAGDYIVWRNNYGAVSEESLNYSGDGLNGVDDGDYLLWRQNFGKRSAAAQASGLPVPEPVSLFLVVIAGSCLILHRTIDRTCPSCSD
jgi:hypothetical protein